MIKNDDESVSLIRSLNVNEPRKTLGVRDYPGEGEGTTYDNEVKGGNQAQLSYIQRKMSD